MNICLAPMDRALCHKYMKDFVPDHALFAPDHPYKPYIYSPDSCDAYFDRHQSLGRYHMAIICENQPIGEVILKNIDHEKRCCTMGVSLQCDKWKNKGYGTQAEKLALQFAFSELGLQIVYADTLIANKRSQHVLCKVGFREMRRDECFVYYACKRSD